MFITQNNENSNENANLVIVQDNKALTTSLKVAEVFEKRHDHVLRDIKKLIVETNAIKDAPNFGEMFYEDTYKRQKIAYTLNRDAFVLLVMRYSGEKALKFQINYINAFNAMEKYINETLKSQSISPIDEKPFLLSVEVEEIWNELKLLKEEMRNENEKQKQFSQGLHQRMCLTEDILDKRPHAGLSFPDIPTSDFFVYFAFNPNNGLTKIGRSKMPESRVWNFQAVEPDLILSLLINTNSQSSSVALEQLFHKIFDDKKHQRELYRLNDYDINVAGIIKNGIELAN
jgi:Rha family phage regulatory protein